MISIWIWFVVIFLSSVYFYYTYGGQRAVENVENLFMQALIFFSSFFYLRNIARGTFKLNSAADILFVIGALYVFVHMLLDIPNLLNFWVVEIVAFFTRYEDVYDWACGSEQIRGSTTLAGLIASSLSGYALGGINQCCKIHDMHYTVGFISKHIADTKFQECLETACKQGNRGHPFLKSLCSHTLPSLFYKAVHKHGDQAYQQ